MEVKNTKQVNITKVQLKRIIKEELKTEVRRIKEEVDLNQVVLVKGLGRWSLDQLRNNVQGKLEDLIKRANKGAYSTIGRTQFSVLEAMWNTLAEHEEQ